MYDGAVGATIEVFQSDAKLNHPGLPQQALACFAPRPGSIASRRTP